MEDIKMAAIKRAAAQIANLGGTIKVVVEGEVIMDTFPPLEEKKIRRGYKNVENICHYKEKLDNIGVGQIVLIEVPEGLTVKQVQSSATSYMATKYGNGSYVSERSPDGKFVTCLRVE